MIKLYSHMSKIKIFMGVTSNTFKINNYNEMKTIKTETENNRKFVPGNKFSRDKFLNLRTWRSSFYSHFWSSSFCN
jgi:hypothetical protein